MTTGTPPRGKPKVGFFSGASCNGCLLTIINLGDLGLLVPLSELVDIVEFRLAQNGTWDGSFDFVFYEGSIATEEEYEELLKLRERTTYLVAIGACAVTGGVTALRSDESVERSRKGGHGVFAQKQGPILPRPIAEVVPVDFFVPGCPISGAEFARALSVIIGAGGKPTLPSGPVCMECVAQGNPCLLLAGKPCLGPVISGGCGAPCPSVGKECYGCRGLVPEANIEALCADAVMHGGSCEDILRRLDVFNSRRNA